MTASTMVLKPRMSEKAYGLSQEKNVYVFTVPGNAVKQTIALAIEDQFKVSVTKVNVHSSKGKAKRTVRKGGRPVKGRTSDQKKAYVTLKSGDSIPIFAAVEESEKKAEKLDKAVTKAAEKTAKKAKS